VTAWVIVYVVGSACHVITAKAAGIFADAATVQDGMADVLRERGIRPEMLVVYGPFTRVLTDGVPIELQAVGNGHG
jgi:hypothetical protein